MKTITITAPEGKAIREAKQDNGVLIEFIPEFDPFQITTFQQAWDAATPEIRSLYEYEIDSRTSKDTKAYLQNRLVIAVLNDGWVPDFKNREQKKWFIWVYINSASLWDASLNFSAGNSYARFGARLCFKSRELAEHYWKHFQELYLEFLT